MSVSASSLLKRLNTTKSDLERQLQAAREAQQEAAETAKRVQDELVVLEKQEQQLTESVVVSEHAIVRYFERILGFNLDEIKAQIMPDTVARQVQTLQSGIFPVGNNGSAFRVRVRNRVAVTLFSNDTQRD